MANVILSSAELSVPVTSCNLKDNVTTIPSTAVTPGPFSDPIYKKLATLNGEVNRMNKEQMKEKLKQLHLDTRGQKDVLKKRLKNYLKRKQLGGRDGSMPAAGFEYLLVIDFEATCEQNNAQYRHEIIEFPAVLIDVRLQKVVAEFHSYVRPTANALLSDFCTELTGITQETVDAALTFPEVLTQMETWMSEHNLNRSHKKKFAIVTDGPWDMSRFMYLQCRASSLPFPRWARKWINIRKTYCNSYGLKKAKLTTMLENLGLALEGPLHSGIADSRNIARVVVHMLRDGCNLRINERIFSHKVAAVANDVAKGAERSKVVDPDLGAVVISVSQNGAGVDESGSSDEEDDDGRLEGNGHDGANEEQKLVLLIDKQLECLDLKDDENDIERC